MDRCCVYCRHYHALHSTDRLGCCHLKPPKAMPYGAFLDEAPAAADQREMQRWPLVLADDLCGSFAWACQVSWCREVGRVVDDDDLEDGDIYCAEHQRFRNYKWFRRKSPGPARSNGVATDAHPEWAA
jgi:hypothetical protein